MTIDLTPEERTALIILLTVEIEASRFPLSPRIEMLNRIRAKLRGGEPPVAEGQPKVRQIMPGAPLDGDEPAPDVLPALCEW